MKYLKTIRIKHQLFFLVSILMAFQIGLMAIGIYSMNALNLNLTNVFKLRLPSIDNLVQGDRDFQQTLVAERTLLIPGLTKEEITSQIKDYHKNKKQVIERVQEYEKLASSPQELALISAFKKEYQTWLDNSNKHFVLDKNGIKGERERVSQISMKVLSQNFEGARTQLDKLQEVILNKAQKEYSDSVSLYESSQKQMMTLFVVSMIFSLLLSGGIIYLISNKIQTTVSSIDKERESLNLISNDLSTSATGLASASSQQASSVEETSCSLHEISQMVKNNTESAVKSSELVKQGKTDLDKALNLIQRLVAYINQISEATTDLTNKVNHNHDRFSEILTVFNNIQDKTSLINDIVFQTKLLSFNASVEAARAGEHGKGFAVVAEEVGNLAQLSGTSADEISDLLIKSLENINSIISSSKSEVSGAVNKNGDIIKETLVISTECEKVLAEVDKLFSEVTTASERIAEASREQTDGVNEINSAVQEISTSNQMTSDNASEVEVRSSKLLKIVDHLDTSVIELKKVV